MIGFSYDNIFYSILNDGTSRIRSRVPFIKLEVYLSSVFRGFISLSSIMITIAGIKNPWQPYSSRACTTLDIYPEWFSNDRLKVICAFDTNPYSELIIRLQINTDNTVSGRILLVSPNRRIHLNKRVS